MSEPTPGDSGPPAHTPPEVKRRSFVNDGIRVIMTNFVHTGCMVAVGILTARIWGAEVRGTLAVIMIVPGLLGDVFDLGMKKVIPRRLGRSDASSETTFGIGISVWSSATSFAMLLALGYVLFFSELDVPIWWHLLAIGTLFAKQLTEVTRGAALGVQDIATFNRMTWLRDPIPVALIIILGLVLGFEAWAYLAAIFIANMVSGLMGFMLVWRHGGRKPRFNLRESIALIREGVVYSAGGNLMRLIYVIDIFILGMMLNWVIANGAIGWFESRGSPGAFKAELGNYTVGVALAQMIWQIPIALGHVLFSRSVNAKDDLALAKKTARLVRTGLVVLVPGAAVVALLAPLVIPLVYGSDFSLAGRVTQILIPGIVAFFAARIFEADLTGKGHPLLVVAAMAPIVAINITLNIFIIPRFGVLGAAAVSSSTYTIGTITLALMYKRVTGIRLRDLFIARRSDFNLSKLLGMLHPGRAKNNKGA